MPVTVPYTGNGATIAGLGVTTFITSIEEIKISQSPLEITTLDTTGYKKMVPNDLREAPEVKVNFLYLGASNGACTGTDMIPTTASTYAGTTVTVTYPESGGSFAGKAFIKEYNLPKAANGEIMAGSYVLQFDGTSITIGNSS